MYANVVNMFMNCAGPWRVRLCAKIFFHEWQPWAQVRGVETTIDRPVGNFAWESTTRSRTSLQIEGCTELKDMGEALQHQ